MIFPVLTKSYRCSNCFREHGALGSYGSYNKEFISSLSQGYCSQPSPSENFGAYLTSYQANKVTPTIDASTSNVLGTQTDVSLVSCFEISLQNMLTYCSVLYNTSDRYFRQCNSQQHRIWYWYCRSNSGLKYNIDSKRYIHIS